MSNNRSNTHFVHIALTRCDELEDMTVRMAREILHLKSILELHEDYNRENHGQFAMKSDYEQTNSYSENNEA